MKLSLSLSYVKKVFRNVVNPILMRILLDCFAVVAVLTCTKLCIGLYISIKRNNRDVFKVQLVKILIAAFVIFLFYLFAFRSML